MGIRQFVQGLFTGSPQIAVVESNDEALIRLTRMVRDLHTELAELQVRFANSHEHHIQRHDTLQLAFSNFRARVYAWKRWEAEAPPEPPQEAPQGAPLDKAAILRAHRSKQ